MQVPYCSLIHLIIKCILRENNGTITILDPSFQRKVSQLPESIIPSFAKRNVHVCDGLA